MPTSHFVGGMPGHDVEVGTFDGRGLGGQAWAKCTCGWTRQDIMFNLTAEGAQRHVAHMKDQAKADRQAETE